MKKKHILLYCAIAALAAGIITLFVFCVLPNAAYGFSREVSTQEQQLRIKVVQTAESWLGLKEEDSSHRQVIDLYNAHEPLAQNYTVTYDDSWCAAFGSAVAIRCGLTDIIPTECGCQRQIALFQELGRWEEADNYIPLPGDYIFYAWDDQFWGDCTGWADHVGIVVGTWGPFIKVIEGNMDDQVRYHYIFRNHPTIRGYGLPDYASKCE